jgi:predicted phage terminase large subunit-like protein
VSKSWIQKPISEEPWRLLPHTFAHHVSAGKWIPFQYLVFLSNLIAYAIAAGNGRILVSVPPRHGKSWFLSQWVPAWFLANWPDESVILSTYEANFAAQWGRRARNMLARYEKELLDKEVAAASLWATIMGGQMATAGVGGPITGKGGQLLLIDDPHKNWQEAMSQTIRAGIHDWYESTFYTRQEPGASIIVLHTRWHQDDLIGWLLAEKPEENWIHVRLPAVAEEPTREFPEPDIMGRKIGEPLCPERYDKRALARIEKNLGKPTWAGLYQQRPSPAEGNLFLRKNWQFYARPPAFRFIVQSWDTALKPGAKTAFSVCQTWAATDAGYYLLDRWRERVTFPDLQKAVVLKYNQFRPHGILIEDKASGTSLIQNLANTPLPIIPVTPVADKYSRALQISPHQEAQKLYLPVTRHSPWTADFVDICATFPSGYVDDVDAMSQAIVFLALKASIGMLISTMGRQVAGLLDGYRIGYKQ